MSSRSTSNAERKNQQVQQRRTKSKTKPIGVAVYIACCLYRIVNASMIHTQFDPDEFWQTLEPAYCQVFFETHGCAYTWEWKNRCTTEEPKDACNSLWEGAVRSYMSILPTYLFYKTLNAIYQLDWLQSILDPSTFSWWISKGPLLLNAILVSAPTDWCVWYISGQMFDTAVGWWCLACSLTSWFHGYALARTYSNSLETVLLMLGIALVISNKNKSIRTGPAFCLGGWSASIRFTALAAWIPLGILLAINKKSTMRCRLGFVLHPCAVCGLVGVLSSVMVDYWFYGYWTWPLLSNIYFNVVQGHGSLYDTHVWHWYISSAIPALTGILFPLVCWDLVDLLRNGKAQQKRLSDATLQRKHLWIIIACYTVLHSWSAHKEFRFLLPIVPLFCILAGYRMHLLCERLSKPKRNGSKSNHRQNVELGTIIAILVVSSYPHWAYLSMVHQRSPISVNRYIVNYLGQQENPMNNNNVVRIHYLMGCHSTPVYSHLHIPNQRVEVWTLDCSPVCRADDTVVCESELFLQDPKAFVQETYLGALQNAGINVCQNDDSSFCGENERLSKEPPDLMAVFAQDVHRIGPNAFDQLGLREEARFIHGISGLTVRWRSSQWQIGMTDDAINRTFSLGTVQLFIDEMVLFVRKKEASA